MRILNYPPVDLATVEPNQIRCGEHVDYGSITLLFQDKNGGLQVLRFLRLYFYFLFSYIILLVMFIMIAFTHVCIPCID